MCVLIVCTQLISLSCHIWQVASLPTINFSLAVQPEWRQRALNMLRITSPHLGSAPCPDNRGGEQFGEELVNGGGIPWAGSADLSMPLYELGSTIGFGGSSVVVHGRHGRPLGSAGSSPATRRRVQRGLAVKVIRKGATEALGDVERSVMWEVHVLQQLNHENIVRVMDVIEVVGEQLSAAGALTHIGMNTECRLPRTMQTQHTSSWSESTGQS